MFSYWFERLDKNLGDVVGSSLRGDALALAEVDDKYRPWAEAEFAELRLAVEDLANRDKYARPIEEAIAQAERARPAARVVKKRESPRKLRRLGRRKQRVFAKKADERPGRTKRPVLVKAAKKKAAPKKGLRKKAKAKKLSVKKSKRATRKFKR